MAALSYPNRRRVKPTRGGGVLLLFIILIPLIVYVVAGAVCLLISKWLDRHDNDN